MGHLMFNRAGEKRCNFSTSIDAVIQPRIRWGRPRLNSRSFSQFLNK
jgi:hypothetical protein